ncbi:MAG TPA: GNAT family N-acetyltransferase [Micromonosporaceae bacterium]
MRLREWDPAVAPDGELRSWLQAYNRALSVDLPDDPPWGPDSLREYLAVTLPGERRLTWLAEGGAGEVVGYGRLLMQTGFGVIELFVVPAARRTDVGTTLLQTIAEHAVADGFTSLAVEVTGETAAVRFYPRYGFRHVYTEMRHLLDLGRVDWEHLAEMAQAVVPGYRIEVHPGVPEHLLPSYAEAKQVRQLDPTGDLDLRPSSYDSDRLRLSLLCLQARGLKPYVVVAIHERSERVAGLTELVVPAQHPTRADQYDTTIVPEHNGYGLARALKARMLLELREHEPQLREVQTWHAADRETLQQVNQELGFKPDREWREYETDARDLLDRLNLRLSC